MACALALAGMSANAMPLGLRTMMLGRAARQSVAARAWTVTFDANGGAVGASVRTVANGDAVGELPTATRDGHTFDGWFTSVNGGTRIFASTIVTDDVTYYAHWTADGGDSATGGGETGGGTTGGGETGGGTTGGGATGGDSIGGVTGGGGTAGGGEIVGDWIAGHLDTSFAKAQTVLGALYGRDGVPVGTMQVKVGKVNKKKGTVKISATATLLADGRAKRVKAKAVNVKVAAGTAAPHTAAAAGTAAPHTAAKVAFKAPIGEMAFEMAADGTFTLKNGSYVMAEKSVGGNWTRAGARVWVDVGGASVPAAAGTAAPHTALPAGSIEELLPDGEPVIPKAGKWSFAKAAGVKYAKDKKTNQVGLVIDTKKGTNLSAMKLTYTPKTGIFKGSFKIYAIQGGKLKKFTVKVIGIVVDGKGWGSAAGPGGASFAVTVE